MNINDINTRSNCNQVISRIVEAVENGQLTMARNFAKYDTPKHCQSYVSETYQESTNRLFQQFYYDDSSYNNNAHDKDSNNNDNDMNIQYNNYDDLFKMMIQNELLTTIKYDDDDDLLQPDKRRRRGRRSTNKNKKSCNNKKQHQCKNNEINNNINNDEDTIMEIEYYFNDEIWDKCCSSLILEFPNNDDGNDDECYHYSCELDQTTQSHLRLPALRELSLTMRIPVPISKNNTNTNNNTNNNNNNNNEEKKNKKKENDGDDIVLYLEQDGYLRQFDVSTVLWPAGYFLAQCVAEPSVTSSCGIPEIEYAVKYHYNYYYYNHYENNDNNINNNHKNNTPLPPPFPPPVGIELGAGIGATSISFALGLMEKFHHENFIHRQEQEQQQQQQHTPIIVATDKMPQALALILANTFMNGLNSSVKVHPVTIDHYQIPILETMKKQYFIQNNNTATTNNNFDDDDDDEDSGNGGRHRRSDGHGFPIVLGSSLLGLFDGTNDTNAPLWKVLDVLLDPFNPHAMAILAHTKADPIIIPGEEQEEEEEEEGSGGGGKFQLLRRISGDVIQMKTRTYETSDFEISIIQRKKGKEEKERR